MIKPSSPVSAGVDRATILRKSGIGIEQGVSVILHKKSFRDYHGIHTCEVPYDVVTSLIASTRRVPRYVNGALKEPDGLTLTPYLQVNPYCSTCLYPAQDAGMSYDYV